MSKVTDDTNGLELLIRRYREKFRIPENLEYYSDEDFKRAEKKFLKFILGRI